MFLFDKIKKYFTKNKYTTNNVLIVTIVNEEEKQLYKALGITSERLADLINIVASVRANNNNTASALKTIGLRVTNINEFIICHEMYLHLIKTYNIN